MHHYCTEFSVSVISMNNDVKGYRQQQAHATRIRIAEAARRLFATRGYSSTSIAAVAAAAGVATRTVYAAFGTKREILSLICERWLEAAGARELAASVVAEADPRMRLRAAAGWLTNLYAAGFDVVEILDAATDEDEQTRELLRAKLAGRNDVMAAMTGSLAGKIPGDPERLGSVFRAFAAPGVYRELVVESGWSTGEFTDLIADALLRTAFPA